MEHALRRYQRGMTATSVILILLLVGFVAVFAVKLAPIYVENFSIKRSMRSLSTETGLDEVKLKERFMKRLAVNDVSSVGPKDVTLVNRGVATVVTVDYSVRRHLFFNIDAVVSFNNSVEVKNR